MGKREIHLYAYVAPSPIQLENHMTCWFCVADMIRLPCYM